MVHLWLEFIYSLDNLQAWFAMGLALTAICWTSPEYPWVSVVSLCLPLSCDDGSWTLGFWCTSFNFWPWHLKLTFGKLWSACLQHTRLIFSMCLVMKSIRRILRCKGYDYLVIGRKWDFEFLLGFLLLGLLLDVTLQLLDSWLNSQELLHSWT